MGRKTKKISIVVPCYNEEENVLPLSNEIRKIFHEQLKDYQYEIIFIDNDSKDGTREKIRQLCAQDKDIKAIFNAKNFGQFNSPFYGLLQSSGDCTIHFCAECCNQLEMPPY